MIDKKEIIIQAFSSMNMSMLEVLLDDSKTYQDATKKTFLEKLQVVFQKFKESSDTELLPYRGKCVSEECPNKGCKGISFIGNISKNNINLIFEDLDLDFKDIYDCSDFKIEGPDCEINNNFSIDILNDEKADFKPSLSTSIKMQNCENACEEIIKSEDTILSKEKYLKWLEKHKDLFKSFNLPSIYIRSFNKFYNLYYDLKNLAAFLNFEEETIKAISDYNNLDILNELELLKWLVLYEDLSGHFPLIYDRLGDDNEMQTGYVKLSIKYNILISVTDYRNVLQFKTIFDSHYWSMLDKYSTLSNDDLIHLIPGTEEYENQCSLKYYLNKRALI